MNDQNFELEIEKSINRSKKTLIIKSKEYSAHNDNRLTQFYRAAEVQCINPTEALVGMMVKHFTSICDMVKNPKDYNLRKWNEKIGDLRNYTFLLDALLRDMEIEAS